MAPELFPVAIYITNIGKYYRHRPVTVGNFKEVCQSVIDHRRAFDQCIVSYLDGVVTDESGMVQRRILVFSYLDETLEFSDCFSFFVYLGFV